LFNAYEQISTSLWLSFTHRFGNQLPLILMGFQRLSCDEHRHPTNYKAEYGKNVSIHFLDILQIRKRKIMFEYACMPNPEDMMASYVLFSPPRKPSLPPVIHHPQMPILNA